MGEERTGSPRSATWISFWLGVWGVGTGCGLFLLLWHERHHPLAFLVALLFAALASFVVESTRALIEGHGHGHAKGSRAPRIVVTILTLVVIELFVVAVHTAVNLPEATMASVSRVMVGELASERLPPVVNLIVVGVVWMALGGALSAGLMWLLPAPAESMPRRVARGIGVGALVGLVCAPLAMLAAVLAGRVVAGVWLFVADHEAWRGHVDWIAAQGWLASLAMAPVKLLGGLWAAGWFGKVLMVLFVVGSIAAAADKQERTPYTVFVVAGLVALVVVPLLAEVGGILLLLGLAAIVWGVPAVAIGAIAPMLESPSAHPRLWGFAAFGGATLLAFLTLVRLGPLWLLVPAVLLVVAGVLFSKRAGPEAFWPLVALCGGLLVAGSTWLRQEATSHGVFERFHALNDVVLPRAAATIGRPFGRDVPPWEDLLGFDKGRSPLSRFLDPAQHVSDAEVDEAAAALPALDADTRALHAQWKASRAPGRDLATRLAGLRALAKATPRPLPLSFGSKSLEATLSGSRDPKRRFLERFSARLVVDIQAVEALAAIEREMGPNPAALSPAVATALLVRLDEGLAKWLDPPTLEHARALRGRLGSAVDESERTLLVEYEAAAKTFLAASDEKRLDPPADLLAALRAAEKDWTNPERRARATALLAELEKSHADALAHERRAAARLLETCLTGSLGFWVCVGLLAGASVLRRGRDAHA
jgi:hypothetical protein